MADEMVEEALWTSKEVARLLGVSESYVRLRSDKGEIPCRLVLGLRRYVPAEIRALAGLPNPDNTGRAA